MTTPPRHPAGGASPGAPPVPAAARRRTRPWRAKMEATVDALMDEARQGGPLAAASARKAAELADGKDAARALAAYQLAADLDPMDAGPRLSLCRLYAEAGNLTAARDAAASAFTSSPDAADRARAAFALGDIAHARGDREEARDAFLAVLTLEQTLLDHDKGDFEANRWRARAEGRLSEIDSDSGDFAEARRRAEIAAKLLSALGIPGQEPPPLAADRAEAELRLAVLDINDRKPKEARERLAQAIGRFEALAVMEQGEAHWRACLADCWSRVAEAELLLGRAKDAREAIDKALKLRVKLATVDSEERWALAGVWRLRAGVLNNLDDSAGAADSLAQARAVAEQLFKEKPDSEPAARFLSHTLIEQSELALAASDIDAAIDTAKSARAIANRYVLRNTEAVSWRNDLASAYDRLGAAQTAGGARAAAMESCTEAVKIRLELAEASPGEMGPARALAGALERLGLAAQAQGDKAGASVAWRQAARLIDRLFRDAADDEGQRVRAIFETHLAGLGEADSDAQRASALARLDALDKAGRAVLADAKLRAKLSAMKR